MIGIDNVEGKMSLSVLLEAQRTDIYTRDKRLKLTFHSEQKCPRVAGKRRLEGAGKGWSRLHGGRSHFEEM